ncbi:MAG: tyrosine-protein phosphatase [Gammaproteobacteria bacterium]|nr:tyrosine-protein phosphatase [Gammaproteobacteria bacterium]
MSAALAIEGLLNARDLGGHPTTDGERTRSGSLLRADDLAQLTPAGIAALRHAGIRSVIDLRWPEEVTRAPNPTAQLPGIHYQHRSLLGTSEEQWVLRAGDVEKLLWKRAVLRHMGAEIRAVLAAIAGAPEGPLLFHCVAGKDRTGLIAALLLALADVEPQAIAADYALSTTELRAGYRARYPEVELRQIERALACPPAGVHDMLAFLAEVGGVRRYLGGLGLSADEIARLRARLR